MSAHADDGGGSGSSGKGSSGDSSSSGDGGSDDGSTTDPGSGGGSDDGSPQSGASGDHDGARRAVEDKIAIPLKDMLAIFRQSLSGEVVDVSLIHGDLALRYRFKYIDHQGHVKLAFFDALSGKML